MVDEVSPAMATIRLGEVIAALSLATDLGIGVPLEHGLHSTLLAMRLADRLKVDAQTAAETYFACLLFYVGCTANADVAAELFGADDSLTTYAAPSRFGSRAEMTAGLIRAVAPPDGPMVRAGQLVRHLPRVARVFRHHIAASCEVATMLTDRLGVRSSVGTLFSHVAERWDGKGEPGRSSGDEIPLPMRIVHVARDAAFQKMLGGAEQATSVVRRRAGHAFDPAWSRPSLMTRLDSLRSMRCRPGTRRLPANRSHTFFLKARRSTPPLPPWVTSAISSRRTTSDIQPAWPIWPEKPPGVTASTGRTSR